MTIRLVVAVVLVTVISMTLQVPEVAVSAYMVFFVTKENRVVTALAGVLLIVGATVAIAASLVLVHWTLEFPALRVIVMAVALFTGMYLSRVSVIGPLGFAIGFVMATAQSFMDGAPNGESAVRALLWLWVLVVYPIALTVVLNQMLLPAHPHIALQQALAERLSAAVAAVRRFVGVGEADAKASAALRDLATRGSASLLRLLHFAESKDARRAAHHAAESAIIAASERLVVAAAALEMRRQPGFAKFDLVCAWALIDEITELQAATRDDRDVPTRENPEAAEANVVELRELQEATTALRDSLNGRTNVASWPSPASLKAKKHLFVADAFSNPTHVHFALKVTLAAMICYVFYTGVDWSGIHTAFITCCFIGLESTGASLRKGWLRLAGCCLGGLLGFVAILHLIPHMETIVSLALLTAAVSAIAGWVAAGSERIAYAGLQIALAFYLTIFQGFAPATDLDVIRDRVAGIVLGIVVVSAVFRYLWPERVIDRLRATLATCLRNLACLVAIPHRGQPEESFTKESMHLCADVTGNIDKCVRLAELTMFEDPEADHRRHSIVLEAVQDLYLAAAGLTSKAACMDWKLLSDEIQLRDEELRKMVAGRLEAAASGIQNDSLSDFQDFESQRTIQYSSADLSATGRAALLRTLLAQTDLLNEELTSRRG